MEIKYVAVLAVVALLISLVGLPYTYVSMTGIAEDIDVLNTKLDALVEVTEKGYGISMDILLGAIEEQTFTIYMVFLYEQCLAIEKAFEEKFPFINMEFIRLSSVKTIERIRGEYAAGQYLCDMVDVSDPGMLDALVADGLLMNYTPPNAQYVPDTMKREPYWYVYSLDPMGLTWNTEYVSDEEAPQTWWDLADPKWKNRIGLVGTGGGGSVYVPNMMWRYGYEEEYGRAFWDAIAANEPTIFLSHGPAITALLAGEIDVLLHCLDDVNIPRFEAGAPLKWIYPDPTAACFVLYGIPEKAPHPNAAKLYLNWMLSIEGQQVIQRVGAVAPVRPDVSDIREIAKQPWYNTPEKIWVQTELDGYNDKLGDMIDEWKEAFGWSG